MNEYELKNLYNQFNELYFNSELPNIPVEFKALKKSVFGTAYVSFSRKYRTAIPGSLRIAIAKRIKWTIETVTPVLLHEMIHIALYNENNLDHGHGYHFQEKLKLIESRCQISIPAYGTSIEEEQFEKKRVCAVVGKTRNEKEYFVLVKPKYIKENIKRVKQKMFEKFAFKQLEIYELETTLAEQCKVKNSFETQSITFSFADSKTLEELRTGELLDKVENTPKLFSKIY